MLGVFRCLYETAEVRTLSRLLSAGIWRQVHVVWSHKITSWPVRTIQWHTDADDNGGPTADSEATLHVKDCMK
jgi:hypothetical protein